MASPWTCYATTSTSCSRGFAAGKKLGIVIMSEEASPYYDTDFVRRIMEAEADGAFDVRQSILGHLQRGGVPTAFDRIQGSRLGAHAARQIMADIAAGRADVSVIGILKRGVVVTPFEEAMETMDWQNERPKEQAFMQVAAAGGHAGEAGTGRSQMTAGSRREVTHPAVPWIVLALTLLALLVNIWGIRKDLPYIPENDERKFVQAAVRIAASGSPNPGWFGHPGSTVIYPAAAAYRVLHGANAQAAFDADFSQFYLIGRIVAVIYATLSVPLIYLVGRKGLRGEGRADRGVALHLQSADPLARPGRAHRQRRHVLWLLSLWRILAAYDRPSTRNQVLAGVGDRAGSFQSLPDGHPGPAAARRRPGAAEAGQRRSANGIVTSAIAGLAALGAAFALSTPYLFLDF